MLTKKELKLLIWNTENKLPENIFLLRMFLVLVGILSSVLYLIPLKDIPKLLARANRRIDRVRGNWHTEDWQINAFRIIVPIIIVVILS